MAKKTAFNEKDEAELRKLLGEKREELRQIRFAQTGARGKDANAAGNARKDIARILTALTAKKTA
ncbi:MAG TPA: 50S ribosomal protein L29 [Candidatus Paceibacterota bacterium]|nr:50S ribosomal protein L29 [Candidatus Paceibacterota bacterium]